MQSVEEKNVSFHESNLRVHQQKELIKKMCVSEHTHMHTLSLTHTHSLSNLESVRGARRWCPSVAAPDSLGESTAVGLGWGFLSVQTDAFSGYSSFFMPFSVPPGLHCCARTLFSCGNKLLLVDTQASHHCGVSCCGTQALEHAGFSNCILQAPERGLSSGDTQA